MKRLRLIFAAWLAVAGGAAFAQNVVYTQGNAKIVQLTDGWQILCGESVVAHGDGTLDIDNLPPAFRDFLDIYAREKEPEADASKGDDEPVYGPLLSTKWHQIAPYNSLFPIVDGEDHALTGCAVTATAQILNYYKYCLPLNLSGTYYTGSSSIESPYISNVTKVEGGWYDGKLRYDYKFLYTPDFEKINSDDEQIAKLFLAIAFVQNADFGLTGTPAFNEGKSVWNMYGYDMLPITDDGKSGDDYLPYIEDLTTNDYISTAIKKGMPVHISGSDVKEGHAFIIDGCHGNEFHINYGWGGRSDGWFTTTLYPKYMKIFTAHPADTNAAFLQDEPKYLNIKGENGFSKRVEMEQSKDNKLEYKQKDQVVLEEGVYEFCFEYADGSTIAPHTDSVIKLTDVYSKQGRFVSAPAKFEITGSYNIDFWIKQNKAEINVVCADYRIAVSGRITDSNSKPIEGVRVSTNTIDPAPAIEMKNEKMAAYVSKVHDNCYYNYATFTIEKNYITQVDIRAYGHNSPNYPLNVEITDYWSKVLWRKQLQLSDLNEIETWTTVKLDSCLPVTAGKKYMLRLTVDSYDPDACYYNFVEGNDMQYRVWTSDYDFVTTDADGRYTIGIDKYSTNDSLSAYHDDYNISPQQLPRLSELSEINFVGLSKKVVVTGHVTGKGAKPVAGAVVTAATTKPKPDTVQFAGDENKTVLYDGMRKSHWGRERFIATKQFVSQCGMKVRKVGAPGPLTVGILDSMMQVLWKKTVPAEQIDDGWVMVPFDGFLQLEPGHEYNFGWFVDDIDNGEYERYVAIGSYDVLYRVEMYDEPTAVTDADGNYSFKVDRNFTGTLHAFSNDRRFNAIAFTNLDGDVKDKNFVEDGDDIVIDGPTSAEQFAAEPLKIWAAGRTIVVENANDEIGVYDAMGRLVCRDAERLATARLRVNATGLYIVRVGSVAKRVFVE